MDYEYFFMWLESMREQGEEAKCIIGSGGTGVYLTHTCYFLEYCRYLIVPTYHVWVQYDYLLETDDFDMALEWYERGQRGW